LEEPALLEQIRAQVLSAIAPGNTTAPKATAAKLSGNKEDEEGEA
jgi:hypothetical protein